MKKKLCTYLKEITSFLYFEESETVTSHFFCLSLVGVGLILLTQGDVIMTVLGLVWIYGASQREYSGTFWVGIAQDITWLTLACIFSRWLDYSGTYIWILAVGLGFIAHGFLMVPLIFLLSYVIAPKLIADVQPFVVTWIILSGRYLIIKQTLYVEEHEEQGHSKGFSNGLIIPSARDDMLGRIDQDLDRIKLPFHERELCLLYTCLRNPMSALDKHPEFPVQEVISDFFEIVGKAVRETEGDIEKLLGDGLMAVFPSANGGLDCCQYIERELRILNKNRIVQGHKPFYLGMSLNYGKVLEGRFLGAKLKDRTIIGSLIEDTIQLNQVSKKLGLEVVASEQFVRTLGYYHFKRLVDMVPTRHSFDLLKIYELFGHGIVEQRDYKLAIAKELSEIVFRKAAGQYTEAISMLDQLIHQSIVSRAGESMLQDPFLIAFRENILKCMSGSQSAA